MAKKVIINFQKEYKLWMACAKDNDVRPVLEYVFFRGGYAYASDGWVLVRVPLDLCTTFDEEQRDLLDGYAIHGQLLKQLVKYEKVSVGHEIVNRDGVDKSLAVLVAESGYNIVKIYLSDNLSVTPPDFNRIFEKQEDATSIVKIGMNPDRVSAIAGALGTKSLKMLFTKESDRVFVHPIDEENESVGVVMPLYLS